MSARREEEKKFAYLGAQHVDSEHVQGLTTNIFRAHVDDTFQAESGTSRSRSDTVLSRARFGNDLGLAESFREEDLADGVVDLV